MRAVVADQQSTYIVGVPGELANLLSCTWIPEPYYLQECQFAK